MKKRSKWPALLVIFILSLVICGYVYIAYQAVKPADDIICDGVFIETIELSGMTQQQAKAAVEQYVADKVNRTLAVDVNGKRVTASLADFGYACEENDYIQQALRVGKDSNPFANYATIRNAKTNHIVYDLAFQYSDKKISKFIKKQCSKECVKAKDSKIKMENGVLTYTKARDGVAIDAKRTLSNIKQAMKEQEAEEIIEASAEIITQKPAVTEELASRCKDKIGTFQTTFNAANVSRSRNLANAARLINGSVIQPGKTFSVHDTISPLTEDNGYYAAPSYNNGKVEDSIGGGVCQVSTTLYNAVLRAELEIVERSPHSMVVTYVKPSMDAAIAGDYKDFKFKNNTEVPVYIESGTRSGMIFFHVYGEETRKSSRKISFESETIETMQPGPDKIIYDKTKPANYTKVTQEAHTGYKAVLWKIVKTDGKTKKTKVNSSTYQAVPRYVTKGTQKVTPKPTAKPTPKASAAPKATPKPAPKAKPTPQPTPVPAATPAPAAQPAQ